MLNIVKSLIAKSAFDSLETFRTIAPWIGATAEPLQEALQASNEVALRDAAALDRLLAPRLGEARRDATLARWRDGVAAWRRWADQIRTLSKELAGDRRAEALLAWLAFADFSHRSFIHVADFDGIDMPGAASFEGAQFFRDAWFSGAHFTGPVNFRGARFSQDALFEQCSFKRWADFRDAVFVGSVRLTASSLCEGLSAQGAQFNSDLWMRSTHVSGPIRFAGARITGEAGFGSCAFQDVDFAKVEFRDNAGFEDSIFAGTARFEYASFFRNARFERARFEVHPNFRAARFYRACHFEDAMMPVMVPPIVICRDEIERRLLQG